MAAVITAYELALTREKLDKINARAARKGLTGGLDLTVAEKIVTKTDELGFLCVTRMYEVALTGTPPVYNGYTLLAVLTWDEHAGLVTRNAPGVEAIDRTGLRKGWCDHCRTERFRNDTYLVQAADGTTIQVGSTCIKDFLGWTGSITFLSESSVESELDWGGYGASPDEYGTDYVLAVAWAAIKAFGFQPASSYGQTTKGVVLDVLRGGTRAARELAEELAPYVATSVAAAAEVRAFIASDAFSGYGDYVTNLKAVAAGEYVTSRNIGLLASAPQAWARHLERTLIKEKEAETPSEYQGAIKERLRDLALTVRGTRYFNGDYGTTSLLTFKDEAGNVYKWFASGVWELANGTTVTLTGTVKGHEEYQGMKQTQLTRCKVTNIVEPAPV